MIVKKKKGRDRQKTRCNALLKRENKVDQFFKILYRVRIIALDGGFLIFFFFFRNFPNRKKG